MKRIPVAFRTFNRLQYLYYSLCSFFSTNAKELCNVTIVDDCSTQNEMKKFLYSNEYFNFNFSFKTDFRFRNYQNIINEHFSKLSDINGIVGINGIINVVHTQNNKGDKGGLLWTIKYMFDSNLDSDFIIILQNDVLFNKQWLNKILYIYNQNKDNAGIISCWNMHSNYLLNSTKKQDYLIFNKGQGIGFPIALITRKLYQKMITDEQNIFQKNFINVNYFINQGKLKYEEKKNLNLAGDYLVLDFCYKNSMNVFSTQKSYIQHIGVGSTCRNWQKTTWHRSTLFIEPFQFNKDSYLQ